MPASAEPAITVSTRVGIDPLAIPAATAADPHRGTEDDSDGDGIPIA